MDLCFVIETLPVELQHIVISYDHLIIFLLPYSKLVKYDWFGLIKVIFSLNYSKKVFTNETMMKIYLTRCRKSINRHFRENTIIKLNDGTLMGCGSDASGMLGDSDIFSRNVFSVIENVPKNIIEINVSGLDTTIRLSDGTLIWYSIDTKTELKKKNIVEVIYGCGSSKYIRFSNGIIMGYQIVGNPGTFCHSFKKIDYVKNVADVRCGNDHTVLRLMDGTLMTCGVNSYGQLGLGDKLDRKNFTEVCGLDKGNIVEIIADYCVSMLRLMDGTIMSCGYNLSGELGLGDRENREIFTTIKLIPKNIDRIAFGHMHTFILLTNGALMSCGDNNSGQLGMGDDKRRDIFSEITDVPRNIIDVYCGCMYTIIRLDDGTLLGTGENTDGQLGLGDFTNRTSFQEISQIPKNIIEVVCYSTGTFIRLSDGVLMGSGSNVGGQLGLGRDIYATNTFIKIEGINGFVTEIA
ncbi:MAG: chromosome condensation regulator [Hyperionvirus sp.]|uniref:Chromosome condensation regulator n=1 Tax=Hyperionvirus sp. TaxID=2487770 RepID=A0A3G5AF72_9VIRU|nr:MAG: chromosome condensation regulator [Hyperionvirus sp.]